MSWIPWSQGDGQTFTEWRDRCVKWLRDELRRHGAEFRAVEIAKTGTAYVRATTRHGVNCCVRLADHRTKKGGERLLSVRLAAAARLRNVGSWIAMLDRDAVAAQRRLTAVCGMREGRGVQGGGVHDAPLLDRASGVSVDVDG